MVAPPFWIRLGGDPRPSVAKPPRFRAEGPPDVSLGRRPRKPPKPIQGQRPVLFRASPRHLWEEISGLSALAFWLIRVPGALPQAVIERTFGAANICCPKEM